MKTPQGLNKFEQELYLALRSNGDSHSDAMETIKAERMVANRVKP